MVTGKLAVVGSHELWGRRETDHGIESKKVEMRLSEGAGIKVGFMEGNRGWVSATTETGPEALKAELGAEGAQHPLSPRIHSRHRGEAQTENWEERDRNKAGHDGLWIYPRNSIMPHAACQA